MLLCGYVTTISIQQVKENTKKTSLTDLHAWILVSKLRYQRAPNGMARLAMAHAVFVSTMPQVVTCDLRHRIRGNIAEVESKRRSWSYLFVPLMAKVRHILTGRITTPYSQQRGPMDTAKYTANR